LFHRDRTIRTTADTIALLPPLILNAAQIETMFVIACEALVAST
jgi:adenosylmethionine-8-amino-7-oxononanoate aminotransferase